MLYYAKDVKEEIASAVADKIGEVFHGAKWADATPEKKLAVIEGIYIMAADITERFSKKEEEE